MYLLKELISRGAKVNARTHQGDTPYKLAATRGRRNIVGLFWKKGDMWKSPKDFELVEAVRNMELDSVFRQRNRKPSQKFTSNYNSILSFSGRCHPQ